MSEFWHSSKSLFEAGEQLTFIGVGPIVAAEYAVAGTVEFEARGRMGQKDAVYAACCEPLEIVQILTRRGISNTAWVLKAGLNEYQLPELTQGTVPINEYPSTTEEFFRDVMHDVRLEPVDIRYDAYFRALCSYAATFKPKDI